MLMALNKRISAAGCCSRREAFRLIQEGQVQVNGQVVTSPLIKVRAEDKIFLQGRTVPSKIAVTRVWIYHKPIGVITTHSDPQGRKTVFAALPPGLPRVISVGRLDINSQGLLILTTSGELARFLELPCNKISRTYHVRVFGRLDVPELKALKNGITIDGIHYGAIKVKILAQQQEGANHWLEMTLTEGKNREIRKVLGYLGLKVSKLIRVQYGPFKLNNLKPGELVEIAPEVYSSYFSN